MARAVGGAILRQVLPKAGPQSGGAAGDSAEGAANAEKPTNTGEEDSKATGLTKPSLPANADDLLKEGWEETTHPDATAEGHRTFVNPKTGQTVQFDKAQPGETGWKGQDHYHTNNPDTTNKRNFYLDSGGRAVPKGSEPSHIPPNR